MPRLATAALAAAAALVAAAPAAAAPPVQWSGQTSDVRRVNFVVSTTGKAVSGFSFVSLTCSPDLNTAHALAKRVKVVKGRFKHKEAGFVVSGRFLNADEATGSVRYRGDGCDTGTVTWTAQKVVVPVTTGY